jgi:hypothetical protein
LCQNVGLSVLSLIRETEKSRVSGDDSHVVFGKKKSLVEKEVWDGAYCQDVKQNYENAIDFALHFPLRGLLPCLRDITVTPALVTSDNPGEEGCIVGGDLTKLLADVDTLLLPISCQKSH